MKVRISRREAKECRYFLRLLFTGDDNRLDGTRGELVQEATEIMRILGAILRNSE